MSIDFRLRPPFGECRNLLMYQPERNARMCASFGMTPSAAARKASMQKKLRKMDQAGIGVIPGRIANAELGNITASTLRALIERHPGRFIGLAGLDPTDSEGAAEITEREVRSLPWRHYRALEPGFTPLCGRCRAVSSIRTVQPAQRAGHAHDRRHGRIGRLLERSGPGGSCGHRLSQTADRRDSRLLDLE